MVKSNNEIIKKLSVKNWLVAFVQNGFFNAKFKEGILMFGTYIKMTLFKSADF